LTLSELIKMFGDIAEVAVTVLFAYVVYKVAVLIETLNGRIKGEKSQ
jgi:hypothetical protein